LGEFIAGWFQTGKFDGFRRRAVNAKLPEGAGFHESLIAAGMFMKYMHEVRSSFHEMRYS